MASLQRSDTPREPLLGTTVDDEQDLELNDTSSESTITMFEKRPGPTLGTLTRGTPTLSPSSPLCWLLVSLTTIAVFGWLGLFICLDGGCSKRITASRILPAWELVPDFPRSKNVTFQYNSSFTTGEEKAVERAWDALISPAHGFVRVEDPKRYGLKPGIDLAEGGGEGYALSVFHQIHCLSAVRKLLAMPSPDNDDSLLERNHHIKHCLDYLRNQIMCSADTSLEHARVGGTDTEVDSWGVVHQCRDWTQVWEFARDHRSGF